MKKKPTRLYAILLSLLLIAGLPLVSHSQTPARIPVTITVLNQKNEPLAAATITLTNWMDSARSFTQAADTGGRAVFRVLPGQLYQVRISLTGYQPVEKGITVTPGSTAFAFIAEPAGKIMEEAVVVSRKPVIYQEDDKTIVNPENLVEASTSGYEVIEKTPGLFVDQDGNIYISSLTPAAVQINGRDMRMSAADMATLLKSLPPGAIMRIEIVRTPSARYDASSSGGIVNVVLKKGVKIGITGSIHLGLQQGDYGNQFAGFNINNSDGHKNSSFTLHYSRRNSYEKIMTDRLFAPDSVLGQEAFTTYPGSMYFASYRYGMPAGEKWELDLSTSLSLNDFDNNTRNRNRIIRISNGQLLSENLNRVSNDGTALNFRSAVNGKRMIDSSGSEWVHDIFYNFSRNRSGQVYASVTEQPYNVIAGGDGTNETRRHHLNVQSDLKLKLKNRFTFETGAKSSWLFFNSNAVYFREFSGTREKDPARTNRFRYEENINALYVQGSRTLGKDLVIKSGVRLENTNMNGEQLVPGDTTFRIRRTDLFPYIYISKPLMRIAGYDLRAYLVYRRTISRPGYGQLNPFPRYIDQFLTEAGNPALRPQFTQNYEANISVDERPILAVGVNDTKDIFTGVVYQSDTSLQQAYRTYDNLGKNKEWYLRGLGAIPPGGRYFFVIGAQYNHNYYRGLYQNQPLSFKRGTWTFFTYQTFKVDKRSVITLNGFLRLKGQQQFYELGSFGALNASINRRFLKDKLVITASMGDMFLTNRNEFSLKQGPVEAWGSRQSDTRRFGLNLRYNFGFRKKEENGQPMFPSEPPVGN